MLPVLVGGSSGLLLSLVACACHGLCAGVTGCLFYQTLQDGQACEETKRCGFLLVLNCCLCIYYNVFATLHFLPDRVLLTSTFVKRVTWKTTSWKLSRNRRYTRGPRPKLQKYDALRVCSETRKCSMTSYRWENQNKLCFFICYCSDNCYYFLLLLLFLLLRL